MSNLLQDCYCVQCGARNAAGEARCFACSSSLKTTQPLGLSMALLHERYNLLERVGEGGFSTVYKAQDTQAQQLVAVKAIHLRGLSSQEKIEATDTFNREVHLLSHLWHPCIPRLYDHFAEPECWYLVMEFIDGVTLEHYLEQHRGKVLPLEKVLELGCLLCNVLGYLHSCNPPVIFRDLKPANILLTKEGLLYLIDFGIARRLTLAKRKDTIPLGSPGYAAPEQYGKSQTTTHSDIYSLGVILYQMFSGHDPIEVPLVLMALPQQREPKVEQLERLIGRMVERESQKRPESVQEVKRELKRVSLSGGAPRVQTPYIPVSVSSASWLATVQNPNQTQIMSMPPSKQGQRQPFRRNGAALASFACGVMGFVCVGLLFLIWIISNDTGFGGWILLNILCVTLMVLSPVLAVILGSVGMHRAKINPNMSTWQAWAGSTLGWILLGVYVLFIWFVFGNGGLP